MTVVKHLQVSTSAALIQSIPSTEGGGSSLLLLPFLAKFIHFGFFFFSQPRSEPVWGLLVKVNPLFLPLSVGTDARIPDLAFFKHINVGMCTHALSKQ